MDKKGRKGKKKEKKRRGRKQEKKEIGWREIDKGERETKREIFPAFRRSKLDGPRRKVDPRIGTDVFEFCWVFWCHSDSLTSGTKNGSW